MTSEELSREFNILWDNIESGAAPGVDEYEKSIFLTIAQSMLTDKYSEIFDVNERARRILSPLTISKEITTPVTGSSVTLLDSTLSKLYALPVDCKRIVQEHCIIGANRIKVKPSTLDDNNDELISPFRKPNSKLISRYNVTDNDGVELLELLSTNTIDSYNIRYIKKPISIITDTTITEDIRESSVPHELQDPVINDTVHEELLDLAVQLAYKAYMDGNLRSQE